MKKKFAILLVFVMLFSLVSIGSGDSTSIPSPLKIGWVYDLESGREQWFDQIQKGLGDLKEEYGPGIIITEFRGDGSESGLTDAVSAAARTQDIVLTGGFFYDVVISEVSGDYLETVFITIDSYPQRFDGNNEWWPYPNVVGYGFVEEEIGFLAGLVAGVTTKKDSIGFIGGMDLVFINRLQFGYEEGILEVNKKSNLYIEYTGSFEDKPAAFYYATLMNQREKADVIFHAAGNGGNGVYESAELFDYWAIGVDVDQRDQGELAPNNVLCSIDKQVDIAVFRAISDYIDTNGSLVLNYYRLGIADEGVNYRDFEGNSSLRLVRLLELYKDMIKDGTYVVPEFIPED